MTTNDQIRDALADVWLMTLDGDSWTWYESPWAHVIGQIGIALNEHAGDYFSRRIDDRLDGAA